MRNLRERWSGIPVFPLVLLLGLLANIVLVNAVLVALPGTSRYDTPGYETYKLLRWRTTADSWEPMAAAWSYLHDDHYVYVYQAVFFDRDEKFQYPLTSLLPIEVMQRLTGDDTVPFRPLDALSFAAVLATAVFVALILTASVRAHVAVSDPPGVERYVLWGIAFVATLTFYPVVKAFTLGQVQTWSNALFAMSLWLWMHQRRAPAGIAAGLMGAIKPQMGLLLVWGLLRRQWWFALAVAATAGVAGVGALVLYGFGDNWDYVSVLRFISRHGEAYYPNQSANGFLNRLLENGDNDAFRASAFPPYDVVVYVGTLASSAIVIAAALFWRARSAAGGVVDFAIAALSFTIASPVAWEHHYGIMLPIYAATLPMLLARQVFGRWTMTWMALSYLLASNYFDITRRAADTPFAPAQSYLLLGALMLLVALSRLRRADDTAAAADSVGARAVTAV
jgi:hypothetical protein